LILFVTTLVLGGVGALDDYLKLKAKSSKGLSGKGKLAVQVLLSLLLCAYFFIPAIQEALHNGIWFSAPKAKELMQVGENKFAYHPLHFSEFMSQIFVPFIKGPVLIASGWAIVALVVFFTVVITGASNAVNLTDGLDGLAAGTVLMVASCLAVFAFVSNNVEIARFLHILYIEGSGEVAIYLAALSGACLGFLWYNGHPAQVFMGDTGSLALGGIIGVSAILLRRELLLALVGGVFVVEALSVILQVLSYRYRNKKRIFLCSPLHHHFEYKGWAETKVVLRFWIVGLLLAILGIASLKFQ
jgi:phospho-N-acetylmuramoyl-pentapeptide-transferase